jgi:CubicO group peptidase (beta-lactamase class C family)
MFTATALGVLVADEKLSWNDTISNYLPSFNPINDPRIAEEATIIDACRHSTGLANPNVVYLGPEGTFSNSEGDHIVMLNALPTSNESGQRFRNWWYYSMRLLECWAWSSGLHLALDIRISYDNDFLNHLALHRR